MARKLQRAGTTYGRRAFVIQVGDVGKGKLEYLQGGGGGGNIGTTELGREVKPDPKGLGNWKGHENKSMG